MEAPRLLPLPAQLLPIPLMVPSRSSLRPCKRTRTPLLRSERYASSSFRLISLHVPLVKNTSEFPRYPERGKRVLTLIAFQELLDRWQRPTQV
jgi:hypothetical protein